MNALIKEEMVPIGLQHSKAVCFGVFFEKLHSILLLTSLIEI
jgi:hypothetical protein